MDTDMMIIAGFAAFFAWAVGLYALPVTITTDRISGNAKNLPGLILMRPHAGAAIWAQELYEAKRAWLFLPVHVPLVLLGRLNPKWAGYERGFELMGHEVEVQAERLLDGYDSTPEAARWREARALTRYRAFEGWSVEAIETEMRRCSWDAQAFVLEHEAKIKERGHGTT